MNTQRHIEMFMVASFIITKTPERISVSLGNKQMINTHAILTGSKRNKLGICNMDESQQHYAKQKKPYVLYDSICKKFCNKQNLSIVTDSSSVVPGAGSPGECRLQRAQLGLMKKFSTAVVGGWVHIFLSKGIKLPTSNESILL